MRKPPLSLTASALQRHVAAATAQHKYQDDSRGDQDDDHDTYDSSRRQA
jgi:hypothetical protein